MDGIQMMNGGRFLSHHPGGVTVYHDSRHRVIKAALRDGAGFMELVLDLELQSDGSCRPQMISYVPAQGEHTVIDNL